MRKWFNHQLAPMFAFLILAVSMFLYAEREAQSDSRELRDAQVLSCQRVNILRGAVAEFMGTAAEARRASGDEHIADQYEDQLRHMRSVRYALPGSAMVDCEEAFPEP